MSGRHEQIRAIRALADAMERQDAARTLPGISCPDQIIFKSRGGVELTAYGDNPVLLDTIKAEIRIRWDELRSAAIERLNDATTQLTHQASAALAPPPPAEKVTSASQTKWRS